MKFSDIGVAVIIVFIILIIIIPIPHQLLDVLLAINISVALIILLNSIYAKDALQMSIFPSLLLITTIYRVSLNVSASRMILSEGEAGAVIEAFGSFVTKNDIVVGFIVFCSVSSNYQRF